MGSGSIKLRNWAARRDTALDLTSPRCRMKAGTWAFNGGRRKGKGKKDTDALLLGHGYGAEGKAKVKRILMHYC